MIEPLLGLGAFALALLSFPARPALDPGPSPECPSDMRLVSGTHYDEEQHLCVDPRLAEGGAGGRRRDTHCFAYWEGVTAEEGKATDIRVCMDQYEAPNLRGERPFVMKSYEDAQRWCGARAKRVCREQEWELACEGPEHRPLSYGWHVDVKLCNSDKQWRPFDVKKLYSKDPTEQDGELVKLWQGSHSGAYASCISGFGVYDMNGNVEEWVASRPGRAVPGSLMGGFWAKPWTGCRGTNDAHEPSFTFYETGFRCCAEPGTLSDEDPPKKRRRR
jgi:formylglycine-generating enzyme required for sulfatase activity